MLTSQFESIASTAHLVRDVGRTLVRSVSIAFCLSVGSGAIIMVAFRRGAAAKAPWGILASLTLGAAIGSAIWWLLPRCEGCGALKRGNWCLATRVDGNRCGRWNGPDGKRWE